MFLFVLHCTVIAQPVQARIIEVKTVGKIGFAVVLATLAVGVKFWQYKDLSKLKNQRSQLLLTEIEPQITKATGNKPGNRPRFRGKPDTGKTGYGFKTVPDLQNGLKRKNSLQLKRFKP